MANLFPFPYADSAKTLNGITYTVDDSDESVTITGTATDASQFYVVEASDPIELGPGYYTLQGTGDSDIQIALISVYTPGGSILYIPAGEDDAEFTLTETKQFHAQIGVPSGTTADLTVTPGLVKTGDLVTIDAENAKQIRRTMDVVIQVTPEQGEPIVINNSNLISCTVSLRSDLSIIEPTLPESEINIEAYFDDDISDVLASIPDETPVTYQAGYPGDMSPVRNFYLAEQITWQDNVMSIHAVDAVHKLDMPIPFDMLIRTAGVAPYRTIAYLLDRQGIAFDAEEMTGSVADQGNVIVKKTECRDIIASLMWLMSPNRRSQGGETLTSIIRYVDAGIPNLYWKAGTSQWDIFEDDCGDVKRNTEKKIVKISYDWQDVELITGDNLVVGSFDWYKGTGAYLSIDEYTDLFSVALADGVGGYTSDYGNWPIIPTNTQGRRVTGDAVNIYWGELYAGAVKLFGPDLPQAEMVDTRYSYYTQFIPWNCTYASGAGWGNYNSQQKMWDRIVAAGDIPTDANSITFDLYGFKFAPVTTNGEVSRTGNGVTVNITLDKVLGSTYAPSSIGYSFPDGVLQKRMENMSNITGSFVWKGDPRMQPRDVVTFHRLDGTTEDITIENITLSHERGGLSAEITYRKGIC